MAPLRCCAATAHAQKAAAATPKDCRRPRPFVEPTVSRPSADRKSDRKNEHRRAAFLAASGRSRETASQMPGATSPPPLRAIGPDHDASTPTGRPLTGTVPDRSSRFSGLAPRPIGHLTRQVSRRVPDESRRSRSLREVDCVNSGETWGSVAARREHT